MEQNGTVRQGSMVRNRRATAGYQKQRKRDVSKISVGFSNGAYIAAAGDQDVQRSKLVKKAAIVNA